MDASEQALAELDAKIKIDQHDLDTELVNQTNDFYHAATGYAMAISLRDQAKNDLDVAEGELFRIFREQVMAREERPTEKLLDSMVVSSDVRQECFDKYLSAKLLADRWLALRDSFTQKGHALRELGELYKLNYFGERSSSAADRIESENRIRNRATGNDPH